MKNNEKGVIFPIVFMISLLFFTIFLHYLNQYILEEQFYHETETLFYLENSMQVLSNELISETTKNELKSGTKQFPTVLVTYEVIPNTEEESQILITCKSKNGAQELSIIFTYNYETKFVSNWLELR